MESAFLSAGTKLEKELAEEKTSLCCIAPEVSGKTL